LPDLLLVGKRKDETVLEVLLARETRTFERSELTSLGELQFLSLVAVDFDGDEDTDLVALASSGITAIEYLGESQFAEPIFFPAPSITSNLAVGDVTGDGRLDVVTTNRLRHSIHVPSRSEAGTLAETGSFPVAGRLPLFVALNDMNGDGMLDAVTVDARAPSISILTNQGEGLFGEALGFDLDDGRIQAMEIADTDGKGSPEIIVHFEDKVGVYPNPADAGAGPARLLDVGPIDTAVVDLDSDGDLDLIVADGEEEVEKRSLSHGRAVPFINLGDGTLVRNPDLLVEARFLVAGDFDGDGGIDIALGAEGPARVELLYNGLEERVRFEPIVSPVRATRPHQIALGDFNGDGLPDVVAANSNLLSHYSIAYNEGDGRFGRVQTPAYSGVTRSVATGDLDGDGDIDLIIGDINGPENGGAQIAVIENLGDEEFAPDVKYSIGGNSPHNVDLGDIDGDGDLDILAVSWLTGSVMKLLNDGTGVMSDAEEILAVTSAYWGDPADLDQDGDLDYAVTDRTGVALFVLRNRGDGVFDQVDEYPLPDAPRVVLHFDIDEDGDFDLLVASGEAIAVFENDGEARFEQARSFDVGREVYFVMALDYDGDGTFDLAGTSDVTDTLSVLRGLGDLDFGAPFHIPAGEGGRPALVDDLDLDGDQDIVVGNRPSNELTVFLNPGASTALPGDDFLETICTPRDFHTLSLFSRSAPVRRALKYILPARDDPDLLPTVYQHTGRFRLHQDFLATVFPERFPSLSSEEYGNLVNRRAQRQYYAGVINLVQTPGGTVYGFNVLVDSSDASELLTQDEVTAVYRRLLESFSLEPLGYFPQSNIEREVASQWQGAEFPIITETGPTGTYQAYTRGVAFGSVRVLDRQAFDDANDRGLFSFRDILVLDHAPRDVETVVAGLITGETQTENSHTFIRMAIRNTPNAFVVDAPEALASHDGQLVHLEVKEAEFIVRPAELEEAQAFWEANRPQLEKPPTLDTTFTELPSLEEVAAMELQGETSLVARFGGKASNLARLRTVLSTPEFREYQENGFVIPMHYYVEFIRSNTMPSALDPQRTVTYEEYLLELFDDERFQTEAEFRFEALDDLRDHMRDEGVVDPDLIARVAVRIDDVMGTPSTTRVRFRSSSNMEDDIQFNGAGLYDSTSGCAADDLDEDDLGPSACDSTRDEERTIERALKRVWKSLWNFKAYEERAFFGIDQRIAAMAVLVNRTFIAEVSNGVAFTGNITNPQDRRFVITAQFGEESVVSPEPGVRAEKDLLTVVDGQVKEIVRASLSTLIEPAGFVLSDEQLGELGRLMWQIEQNFPVELGDFSREQVLLDMEFKFMPSGELAIKQVRPFLLNVPPPPTPEFELEIPASIEVCGVYVPFQSAADAYAAKSTLRLASGVHALVTDVDRYEADLIEELRFGPEQLTAVADAAGMFEVRRAAAGGDVTSYIFSYEQPFSLSDGSLLRLSARLMFRARGEEVLDGGRLVLDEAFFTTEPGSESFGVSLDGNSLARYGSCGFDTLQAFRTHAEFEDGATLDLTERIGDEEDRTFFAAPAALTRARVMSGDGVTATVASYWQLVYAAGNHNDPVDYWVVLDAPQAFPGVQGEVFALEFKAPPVFREAPGGRAGELSYLGEDLSVLKSVALRQSTRGELTDVLFRRGDVQADGEINLVDTLYLLEWLFRKGPVPPCLDAADADSNGKLDIADPIAALGQLLRGTPVPAPFPACGTGGMSPLGCESFTGCN
jgi:hypothetical protein